MTFLQYRSQTTPRSTYQSWSTDVRLLPWINDSPRVQRSDYSHDYIPVLESRGNTTPRSTYQSWSTEVRLLPGGHNRQCQTEVQGLACLKTKLLVIFWRWLTLSSWCQNLADIYRFPYICDPYRQHLINSSEYDDWIKKMPIFWKYLGGNLDSLCLTQHFSQIFTSNHIVSYIHRKLLIPALF